MEIITPAEAKKLVDGGAKLIDIRSDAEYKQQHIPMALHISLDQLSKDTNLPIGSQEVLIFHCLSGMRTKNNAEVLEKIACAKHYILDGGLNAWKKAGLPVVGDGVDTLSMNFARQAQILAGIFIVLGFVLGMTINPWFHLLSGLIGLGLIIAGATGSCMLALILSKFAGKKT